MLPIKPKIKIVATILLKNEEDVISTTIEHHINQGVSAFIITDNSSTDKTKEIVGKYPEVVELIDEPGEDHNQSKWVSRMAQIACKLNPDWIVHLDADELWGGLSRLREIDAQVVGCETMYLHPPCGGNFDIIKMRHYLDFDQIPIPQECKVAHRPDPSIIVTHGNHGIEGKSMERTSDIFRHHYPIRSYEQWVNKSVQGHQSLAKRGSICERWKKWHDAWEKGELKKDYENIVNKWRDYIQNPSHSKFLEILGFWATPEIMDFFKSRPDLLPRVGEWPAQTTNCWYDR